MKKILITICFFALFFFLKNDSVFAQQITGLPCSQENQSQNCTIPNPTPHTGCCVCNGSYWQETGDSPCSSQSQGNISNPVVSGLGSGEGADAIAKLVATVLKIAYSVAGLILLAMLLSGGIGFMTAGGDKSKVEAAQGRISSAIIGFVIFMSVFVIINFIAPALGLTFLQILTIEWPTIL
ncbi:pilin [Patescibacteria group bacterium]|nr:pilin [Patescibacteria group bacterium]